MMEKKFNAQLDSSAIFTTILFNLLVAFVVYSFFFNPTLLNTRNFPLAVQYFFVFAPVVLIILIFLIHPRNYSISENEISINKILMPLKIPIENISEVRKMNYADLELKRKYGSGGGWGYFGSYRSGAFGEVNLQATNRKDAIVIIRKEKKVVVISPEEPEKFLEIFNNLKSK